MKDILKITVTLGGKTVGTIQMTPERDRCVFEYSLPDGYGLNLLDRMLRREGSSLLELSPLQRLSLVGNSGMGALCYKLDIPAD